eukprot:comp21070_c0_seq1/m.28372 comp21070_c0_seq1/g.28372  ORF comp21070_c0_seq1/g.28372 comp21070_c0_seq1/m.28372 type:complete len:106 (-) comp21070_c0_seq1:1298-1615(-)
MSSAITKVPWGRYCDKVVQDFGGGFVMGAVGGGLYHFVKGVGNSPGLRVGVGAGLNAMKKRYGCAVFYLLLLIHPVVSPCMTIEIASFAKGARALLLVVVFLLTL